MWIFDSYRRGCVELWGKEHDLSRVSIGYPPSFYLHLREPHARIDIEALHSAIEAGWITDQGVSIPQGWVTTEDGQIVRS